MAGELHVTQGSANINAHELHIHAGGATMVSNDAGNLEVEAGQSGYRLFKSADPVLIYIENLFAESGV